MSPPPSPPFSQLLCLKAAKVLCFDTLLQVLILKGLRLALKLCRFGGGGRSKGDRKAARSHDESQQGRFGAPVLRGLRTSWHYAGLGLKEKGAPKRKERQDA